MKLVCILIAGAVVGATAMGSHGGEPGEKKKAEKTAAVTLESTEALFDGVIQRKFGVATKGGGLQVRVAAIKKALDVKGDGLLSTVAAAEAKVKETYGKELATENSGLLLRVDALEKFIASQVVVDFYKKNTFGGKSYFKVRTQGKESERIALLEEFIDKTDAEKRKADRQGATPRKKLDVLMTMRPDIFRTGGLAVEDADIVEAFESELSVKTVKGASLVQRIEAVETILENAQAGFLRQQRAGMDTTARLIAVQRRLLAYP